MISSKTFHGNGVKRTINGKVGRKSIIFAFLLLQGISWQLAWAMVVSYRPADSPITRGVAEYIKFVVQIRKSPKLLMQHLMVSFEEEDGERYRYYRERRKKENIPPAPLPFTLTLKLDHEDNILLFEQQMPKIKDHSPDCRGLSASKLRPKIPRKVAGIFSNVI